MKMLLSLSVGTMLFAGGYSAAFAAGESTTNDPPPKPVLHCKTGEVVKKVTTNGKTKEVCVKVKAGILPDEDLYQQGRFLAKAGKYEWALEVLAAIGNQNDPRVLNYTGYSNRKAGRIELGITYYNKALAINPNFVLAREYLGEGYVAAGRIDLAKVQLEEIKARAGTNSEEYKDLHEAITTGL